MKKLLKKGMFMLTLMFGLTFAVPQTAYCGGNDNTIPLNDGSGRYKRYSYAGPGLVLVELCTKDGNVIRCWIVRVIPSEKLK